MTSTIKVIQYFKIKTTWNNNQQNKKRGAPKQIGNHTSQKPSKDQTIVCT